MVAQTDMFYQVPVLTQSHFDALTRLPILPAPTNTKHINLEFLIKYTNFWENEWRMQDLAIVASGPVKLLPDYNWFRRRTYKLRY